MTASEADWPWHCVRAEVLRRGTTLEQIAKGGGLEPKALSKVKTRRYHRAQCLIARALGRTPQQIWPSRYLPNGDPKTGTAHPSPQDSRKTAELGVLS